jgi:hypothetical protein
MVEDTPFIDFNIQMVKDLKERYEENLKFIESELPSDCEWNRPKEVIAWMKNNFDIQLESVKIAHVLSYLEKFDHDSVAFDVINGYVLYLKTKYTLANYINCIIKHEQSGRVYLRHEQGEWVLPNKRPTSESPEIRECIVGTHIPKKEKRHGSKKQR